MRTPSPYESMVSIANSLRVKIYSKCNLYPSYQAVVAVPLLVAAAGYVEQGLKGRVMHRVTHTLMLQEYGLHHQ